MRPIRSASAVLLAAAVIGAGCGDDGGDGAKVVATTGVLADVTRELAGDRIEVVQLVPDGASPHDFQLSAKDRAEAEDAELLVHNGASLEEGIPVEEIDAPEFVLTDHTDGGGDPHVWMDPTLVAPALPALAAALGRADPDGKREYERRAREFAAELAALDREIRRTLSEIPSDRRKLVTSHDSLGLFADRYGLEVVATPFGTAGADAEPSASTVRDVIAAIRSEGVPAVFAQEGDSPELLGRIADQAAVEVVEGLLVESPSTAGGYLEMLRHDAKLIAGGLG